MHYSQLRIISGEHPRRGYKKEMESLDRYFQDPIIHRQIHGEEIYTPLNLHKIWDRIG
ncbi:hypothetical protein V7122_02635 [Bacillus sp. JJ1532]|uniref:hypothetical protein n=1 Tax=Bacillus sp. JJ1532 TaxID=3122958 RepID=UPI002FFF2214